MIDRTSNTLAQAETRLHRYTHSMYFWEAVEAPILVAKTEFYNCKYVHLYCEDSIHDTMKRELRPSRATWHPPARPAEPADSPAPDYPPAPPPAPGPLGSWSFLVTACQPDGLGECPTAARWASARRF
ncbi:hypothetical protein [Saccharothrix sp. ALI-22-I]|uniref:hypothetical protein n=1 Tax=Saccharothrix sp. ALI-22-I TaxID=1933778 RepID=UPI00117A492C|nr:hypothetical protein [Saccharothrix sp. ALI-22-I]